MREKIRKLPLGLIILTILALTGFASVICRYLFGLGAVSNMSDGRGWGMWIGFDLYCGVALAAGGFTTAAIVYIFGGEKYHSVARPAILTAFLGYLLVILALLVDLGEPWYIWHAIIYWNIHSPLFEVAMCVMTYTFVLALEFSPAVFERLHWNVPLKIIHAIEIPLIILGICLSTLHQSSLGSMLLMMPTTLHPIWYTPILPILFYFSALAVGPAVVMFESTITGKSMGHEQNHEVMEGLGKIIPWILGIYLMLKVGDLLVRGNFGLVFTDFPHNILWWAEMLIGVILPIILFSIKKFRRSNTRLFWGAALVVLGLIINRFNVSLINLQMRPGYTYFPSWVEIATSVGLFADAMLVIWLAYKVFPMIKHSQHDSPTALKQD